ncbi:phytochrome B [Actinidia rufa]|uniref:Phytochrome B n=1 Tax=Actinidia rufa TaxID=165716 RepID=A0A7J0HG95_9ERIC|nr:phytochrome B [Actinidia rufa]
MQSQVAPATFRETRRSRDYPARVPANNLFQNADSQLLFGSVIDAVVSQVMILLRERGLQLIRDIPEEIKTLAVYGDQVRIQQVLADFLLNMVRYAPSPEGWVEIQVRPRLEQISDEITILHIEFRIVCPGEGLPPELVQDMFHSSRWVTQEGLALSMCRKILKLMNGEVQYIRESERCYFLIILELPMPRRRSRSVD